VEDGLPDLAVQFCGPLLSLQGVEVDQELISGVGTCRQEESSIHAVNLQYESSARKVGEGVQGKMVVSTPWATGNGQEDVMLSHRPNIPLAGRWATTALPRGAELPSLRRYKVLVR
jgi:hypothetical protein